MVTENKAKSILLGLLAIVAISSGAAFFDQNPTGFVVGIPQSCRATINFDAPAVLDVGPGELKEATITVTKVTCGVSYVRLSLNGMPSQFYTVGPNYIGVISPSSVPKEFTIYFDIPPDAEGKSYTGIYTIYSNEGTYTFGELQLNVATIEKPRLFVESTARVSQPQVPESVALMTLYGLVFFASLVTLIFVGYEYFVLSKKQEFGKALKRQPGSIYKALGRGAPERTVKFESALKKAKKRR